MIRRSLSIAALAVLSATAMSVQVRRRAPARRVAARRRASSRRRPSSSTSPTRCRGSTSSTRARSIPARASTPIPTVVMPRRLPRYPYVGPRLSRAYLPPYREPLRSRRAVLTAGKRRRPLSSAKPLGRDIERERGGIRHIERLDPARQLEPADMVAAFARQLPQPLPSAPSTSASGARSGTSPRSASLDESSPTSR